MKMGHFSLKRRVHIGEYFYSPIVNAYYLEID
jgi:hypothetical protein